MKLREKIMLDTDGLIKHGPINIVIFGDSLSRGAMNGYFDQKNVYWSLLWQKLVDYRNYMPINIINEAVGGTSANGSLKRLERAVTYHPDVAIVCFALNDVNHDIERYTNALAVIFERFKDAGAEVVFMTPNMMNTYVAEGTPEKYLEYAKKTADMQNGGRVDEFIEAARRVAAEHDVAVCDCYAKWKELAKTQDTTLLLANRINHPSPEMHRLFADELFKVLIGEDSKSDGSVDDAMYRGN